MQPQRGAVGLLQQAGALHPQTVRQGDVDQTNPPVLPERHPVVKETDGRPTDGFASHPNSAAAAPPTGSQKPKGNAKVHSQRRSQQNCRAPTQLGNRNLQKIHHRREKHLLLPNSTTKRNNRDKKPIYGKLAKGLQPKIANERQTNENTPTQTKRLDSNERYKT